MGFVSRITLQATLLSVVLVRAFTPDKCSGQCGQGTSCQKESVCFSGICYSCKCDRGFLERRRVPGSIPAIYYCLEKCDAEGAECPGNTECRKELLGDWSHGRKYQNLCVCLSGASLSSTGQCLSTNSPTATPGSGRITGIVVAVLLSLILTGSVITFVIVRRGKCSKADEIQEDLPTGRIYSNVTRHDTGTVTANIVANVEQQQQCAGIHSAVIPDVFGCSAQQELVRNASKENHYAVYEEIDLPPDGVMVYDNRDRFNLQGRSGAVGRCDIQEYAEYNKLYSCQNRVKDLREC